jgi:hypothetical protein
MAKNLLDDSEIGPFQNRMLIYYTEDGSKICETKRNGAKIKFYISVNTILDDVEDFKEVEAVLDQKIKNIITAMQLT